MSARLLLSSLLLLAACSGNGTSADEDASMPADDGGQDGAASDADSGAATDGGADGAPAAQGDGGIRGAERLLYDDLLPIGAIKQVRVEPDSYPEDTALKLGQEGYVLATVALEGHRWIAAKIEGSPLVQERKIVAAPRDDLSAVAPLAAEGFLPRISFDHFAGASKVVGQRIFKDRRSTRRAASGFRRML